MLPLLRPLLRRPPRLKFPRPPSILPLRLQHDQHGPHKEYFQHPSQFPSNAYELRVPPPEQKAHPIQHQDPPEPSDPPPSSSPRRLSLLRRFLRSSLIVGISITLGWAVGTAVITWDYIQPPFEPGSEDAKDMIEEIDDLLETCLFTQDLRDAGFQEEQMHRISGSGKHLVTSTLNDIQGVKTKFFRHPANTGLSILVFFAGFGIEGWPDYVHGGAITTMMTEAVNQHCVPLFEAGDLESLPSGQLMSISFVAPVRPGEVYAVLVDEQTAVVRPRDVGFMPDTDEVAIAHGLNVYLISSDSFPAELVETFGDHPASNMSHDETQMSQASSDTISEGEQSQYSVLTLPESAFLHAAGQLDVMSRSKHVVKEEGEDDRAYATRLTVETQRALQKIHAHVDIGKKP